MDTDEVASELDTFASWPRAFTVQELLDFADSEIDGEMLERALESDRRFVPLGGGGFDGDYFIAESALFRWFIHLSLRLAQASQARLDQRQLAIAMSSLRHPGRWDVPPPEIVEFGERFAFCVQSRESSGYVFPVARLLSSMSSSRLWVAADLLESAADLREPRALSEGDLRTLAEQVLSPFEARVACVVQAREGLLDPKRLTLEETAAALSVAFGTQRLTRERIRQLEAQFWRKIGRRATKAFLQPLLGALLRDVMGRHGSLILRSDRHEGSLRRFVAKCAGISWAEPACGGLAILGARPDDLAILNSPSWFPDETDQDSIARRLHSEAGLGLVDGDVRVLAGCMSRYLADDLQGLQRVVKLQSLNKAQKVYLALREIGKPAHYSAITEVYNRLFPDDPSTERNTHAILCRKQNGVVWIGVRGTFALEEWGYERPSKRLFDAVADIVERQYEATGTPVPFAVIAAEMGKLRRVVKSSSLTFAAHFNRRLRRVSSDSFVPRAPDDQAEEEIAEDELDRILQEFEENVVGDSDGASAASAELVADTRTVPKEAGRFARLGSMFRSAFFSKKELDGDRNLAEPEGDQRQDEEEERTECSSARVRSAEPEVIDQRLVAIAGDTRSTAVEQEAGVTRNLPESAAVPSDEQGAEPEHEPVVQPRDKGREQTEALAAVLRSRGLEVIDERPHGGFLWVVGGKELYSLLSPRGFVWGPRGASATGNRAGWYVQ
jgi:hypothetical protein